jgi:hypothetical protein
MSDLYNRIQNELVTSGKYKEIYNILENELRNCGWYDNFRQLTERTIEQTPDQDLQFAKLVNILEPQAMADVPDDVKVKVLQKIAEFLNNVVE